MLSDYTETDNSPTVLSHSSRQVDLLKIIYFLSLLPSGMIWYDRKFVVLAHGVIQLRTCLHRDPCIMFTQFILVLLLPLPRRFYFSLF